MQQLQYQFSCTEKYQAFITFYGNKRLLRHDTTCVTPADWIGQDNIAQYKYPICGKRKRWRGEEKTNVSGMLQFEECLQLKPATASDLMSDFRISTFTACFFSAGFYYVTSTLTSGFSQCRSCITCQKVHICPNWRCSKNVPFSRGLYNLFLLWSGTENKCIFRTTQWEMCKPFYCAINTFIITSLTLS